MIFCSKKILLRAAVRLLLITGLADSLGRRITHFGKPVAPPSPAARAPFSELTSAATDPADSACARSAIGSAAADPPELSSANGKLEVTFHFQSTTDLAGLTRYCYVYTDASAQAQEAPSLLVNPGDELIIHFYNDLAASSAPAAGAAAQLVTQTWDNGPNADYDPGRPMANIISGTSSAVHQSC